MSGFVGWSKFSLRSSRIAERITSFLGANLQGGVHALYESITGSPALGNEQEFMHPHDHGLFGGIPIPRGSHWTYDSGFDIGGWIIHVPDDLSTYWRDRSGNNRDRFDNGEANMLIDVPFGLDSVSLNSLGLPCSFEASVWAYCTPGTGATYVDFLFYNRTTGSQSSKQRINLGDFGRAKPLFFYDIPIRGGQRNELLLCCEADNPAQGRPLSVNICSTRERSQPRFEAGTLATPDVTRPK